MSEKPNAQTHAEVIRTFVAIISATAQILVLLRVFEII